mmetsp:Transcript_20795/g.35451  ORF Transcript_20795/g.35451 Transcript_20795/m.35451 type:complete len:258 (-) Transcript_20795:158-931(-)
MCPSSNTQLAALTHLVTISRKETSKKHKQNMTSTFAHAQLAQPTNNNASRSAYNNYQVDDEPDIVVPTASAQILPTTDAVPTAPTAPTYNSAEAVTTTAVATPYVPGKPTIATTPNDVHSTNYSNNNTTTTTTTGTSTSITTVPATSSASEIEVAAVLAAMKQRRKANQAFAATTGALAGLIVLGPLGAALGGLTAHAITKGTGRAVENRVRKQFYLTQQQGVVATPVNRAAVRASRTPSRPHHRRNVRIHRGHSVV